MTKDFFTVKEFMDKTGISRALAYKLVAGNEVPTIRMGNRILIPAWYIRKLSAEPTQQGA